MEAGGVVQFPVQQNKRKKQKPKQNETTKDTISCGIT
jgi:hypothetical protein